jgi:hypothetical protein
MKGVGLPKSFYCVQIPFRNQTILYHLRHVQNQIEVFGSVLALDEVESVSERQSFQSV